MMCFFCHPSRKTIRQIHNAVSKKFSPSCHPKSRYGRYGAVSSKVSAFFFASLLSILLCQPGVASSAEGTKTLVVTGIEDQTDSKEFNNQLIAQGLSNLIEEELFNTGKFVPLETNAEIQEQIQQLVLFRWHPEGDDQQEEIARREKSFASDVVVSGIVKDFRKRKKKVFAGPFSSAKVTISFVIELVMKEGGNTICTGSGKGHGVTKQNAVFFQIREDKIHFDETTIGMAAREAVNEAVTNMMDDYEKRM